MPRSQTLGPRAGSRIRAERAAGLSSHCLDPACTRPEGRDVDLETRHLERLLDIGRSLVSELDLDTVLSELLESARELTGARYAALGVLDEAKVQLERFLYVGIDEATRQRIGPLPRGHGLLGELIRNPSPLRLARISDHPRSYGFPAEHPPMTSFLGVPVLIRGVAYGNLYLTEKAGGEEFSERDEELLGLLSQWAGIAIDNARSHGADDRRRRELERSVRGLEATVTLSRELGLQTELPRVLELVAKRGRALVDARICLVLLVADDELELAQAAGEVNPDQLGRSLPRHGSPASDVLTARVPQRIGRSAASQFGALGIEANSGLLVPLFSRGIDLGVLAAFDPLEGDEFGADEQLLLESFSVSASVAIAGTRVVEGERLRLAITASENERRRWARELHDETLQELGALRVMQESALQIDSIESMRHALITASEQVGRTIAGLEGLITELRPAALDQLGIEPALEVLVERLAGRGALAIELDIALDERNGEGRRYVPELEATIYRLVQEALNNVVKHADAEHAWVAVEERGGEITVAVEDDGGGIDPGREDASGFGLVGMRERVELIGGALAIEPRLPAGTRIFARLPASRPVESSG